MLQIPSNSDFEAAAAAEASSILGRWSLVMNYVSLRLARRRRLNTDHRVIRALFVFVFSASNITNCPKSTPAYTNHLVEGIGVGFNPVV